MGPLNWNARCVSGEHLLVSQLVVQAILYHVSISLVAVDNGLPSVPPITVHIPWNYPSSSPVCQLSSYQSDSSTAFLREVALLLGNQLTCCQHNYSLSFLLGCWENSVLEVTSKEINSEA